MNMKYLSRVIGITRMDRIKNEDVNNELGVESIINRTRMVWTFEQDER